MGVVPSKVSMVNTKFMRIKIIIPISRMPFSGYLTPHGSYHTRFGDNDCNQWQPDVNTMAVPTYEELLAHCKVGSSLMEQTFSDDHLMEFGSQLDE